MGDDLSEEEPPPRKTYTELFEEAFPQYLMIGMTPEQYWDGEAGLCTAYREAYRMKVEREDRIADQTAWLQGMYIRDALQSVYLLVNGFVPKNTTAQEYPRKPYSVQEEERKQQEEKRANETRKLEEKRKQEEQQRKMSMAYFQAMAAEFNKNFEKRQKEKAT